LRGERSQEPGARHGQVVVDPAFHNTRLLERGTVRVGGGRLYRKRGTIPSRRTAIDVTSFPAGTGMRLVLLRIRTQAKGWPGGLYRLAHCQSTTAAGGAGTGAWRLH
jgi:hypothetical protein